MSGWGWRGQGLAWRTSSTAPVPGAVVYTPRYKIVGVGQFVLGVPKEALHSAQPDTPLQDFAELPARARLARVVLHQQHEVPVVGMGAVVAAAVARKQLSVVAAPTPAT